MTTQDIVFKLGDYVQLKKEAPARAFFWRFGSGVVVGFATIGGAYCLVLSMDEQSDAAPRFFSERLVVPLCDVEFVR